MAEMLIIRQDKFLVHRHQESPEAFAAKEARGWRKDDVVAVREDGWPWTDKEKSVFSLVKIPGLSVARLSKFCIPQYEVNPDVQARVDTPVVHKNRSLYQWRAASLEMENKGSKRKFSEVEVRNDSVKDDFDNLESLRQ